MRELRPVVDVHLDETALFFRRWIVGCIARVGCGLVVVVVTPFGKVVSEFETSCIGA